jgi:hypothetical protein
LQSETVRAERPRRCREHVPVTALQCRPARELLLGGLIGSIGVSTSFLIITVLAPKAAVCLPAPRDILPLRFAQEPVGLRRSLVKPIRDARASSQLTQVTGCASVCGKPGSRQLCPASSFHSLPVQT